MNPRLRRLQADYDAVRDTFSGHPNVKITPVGKRLPPEVYRAEFALTGLALKGSRPENLDFHEVEVSEVSTHVVEIMLPRLYPAEKPYVVPKTPIFHPNIQEYYCLVDDEYWAPSTKLVDLIAKIGDMIQYRVYNLSSPLDGLAAHWTRDQEPSGRFPVGDFDLHVAEVDVDVAPKDLDFVSGTEVEEKQRLEVSFADQPVPAEGTAADGSTNRTQSD